MTVTPFKIDVPDAVLARIKNRIDDYEWFEEPVDSNRDEFWKYGTNGDFLRELCDYWSSDYDWRTQEAWLNRFDHFKGPTGAENGRDGPLDIHFIHERGSNPDNDPILILHGWPGSFVEHMETIEPIAHPERFGGDAADGRDVIVPSLIGYGWSGKPKTPMGPRGMGVYFNDLMTGTLGYNSYVAQGGDWGALVVNWMGYDNGADRSGKLKAIHVNLVGVRPSDENGPIQVETDEEKAWELETETRYGPENAYFQVQATKPQSLSYGMMDSPVGTCAWITEKFYTWSDRSGKGEVGGNIEATYTKDQLLNNVMVYITSRSFNTAAWNYYGAAHEGAFALPAGEKIGIPTGVMAFPREIVPVAPRSYIEKGYNVVRYTNMPKGGHFGAMEQPEDFCKELAAFLKEWG